MTILVGKIVDLSLLIDAELLEENMNLTYAFMI